MNKTIVIADDHQLVRAGIKMLIQDIDGFEIIAEASDGKEALDLVMKLKPDIAILDITMPVLTGLECLQQISLSLPETRVLILSMHSSEEHVLKALKLGASGYMIKDSTPDELELAIKSIMTGNTWLSAVISPTSLEQYARRAEPSQQDNLLSPRQTQVLKSLAQGQTVKQIAYDMDLSTKTIETYRSQIMKKLSCNDLPSLVRYAIKNGIIPL